MLPIMLAPHSLRIGVAGAGEGLAKRLCLLDEAGVAAREVYDSHLPSDAEIAALHILFIAGLDEAAAMALAASARKVGVLVNVEDKPELCDFHVPAIVRRGDLLLTVSTGGRSPGLAHLLRRELERRFGPEWSGRMEEIAALRRALRAQGVPAGEITARTRAMLDEKGWMS